jgi:hypothetical protein
MKITDIESQIKKQKARFSPQKGKMTFIKILLIPIFFNITNSAKAIDLECYSPSRTGITITGEVGTFGWRMFQLSIDLENKSGEVILSGGTTIDIDGAKKDITEFTQESIDNNVIVTNNIVSIRINKYFTLFISRNDLSFKTSSNNINGNCKIVENEKPIIF